MAPDQMRSYISYALGLAQKHDLRAEEAEIWFFRTTLSLASHDLAGALSLIDEVIARASQCGHTNLLKQGMGLKGNTLERQGRYHDAVDVYQELARFADTIGDGLLKSECIYSIANLQHKMGHENLSKESLHEAIRVYEKEAYPQGKANCLKLLGVYAADESRNVEALGYYTEATRLYEETGDWVGYGNCFHNLGLLYREGHENETALGYFMEALAAYTSAASLAGVGIAHMESGRTYFMMNNYAAAEISFTLAETFLVKGQALARLAGLNSYMGDLKAAQGMNEKAAGYYTKSISLYEEVGLRDDAASQRMNLLKVRPITSDRKAR